MFQPVHRCAVEFFLDRDVGHGGARRGTVPVLLAGREPDHVTGVNLLGRSAHALHQTATNAEDGVALAIERFVLR